jgi:uncharacterized membrane protein SpoIIM required for sporulation
MNLGSVTIERVIMEIPPLLAITTFGIGFCIAVIDSLMYRHSKRSETEEKQE